LEDLGALEFEDPKVRIQRLKKIIADVETYVVRRQETRDSFGRRVELAPSYFIDPLNKVVAFLSDRDVQTIVETLNKSAAMNVFGQRFELNPSTRTIRTRPVTAKESEEVVKLAESAFAAFAKQLRSGKYQVKDLYARFWSSGDLARLSFVFSRERAGKLVKELNDALEAGWDLRVPRPFWMRFDQYPSGGIYLRS
jgi:hypothetical protein